MSSQSELVRIKHSEADTLLIFPFLLLAIGSVVYGLSSILRDLEFSPLLIITLGALLLSWIFARTKINGWFAGLLIILIGVVLIFAWVGDFWSSFTNSLSFLDDLLTQLIRYESGLSETPAFDWSLLLEIIIRFDNLFLELGLWFRSLIAGRPVYNHAANALLWGFAIWTVSAWAGWFQRRHKRSLIAVFPAGLLLMISMGYTYGKTTVLYPFVFATLLLTAMTFYFRREHSWMARKMDYPKDERFGNLFIAFSITLGFLVTSAVVSQISIDRVVETFLEIVDPQMEEIDPILDSLGLEGASPRIGNMSRVVVGGLPRKHLIGSGPELSDQIVMSVKPEEDPSGVILPIQEWQNLSIPLYWRAITYDRYTGHGWESSDVILQNYTAGEFTHQHFGNTYQILRQTIRFREANDLVYAAGEPLTLNTDYSIAWRTAEETTENLRVVGDIFAGSQLELEYQVDSLVPVVSKEVLADVENIYPTWVVERYLTLPDNVSQRVFDLAQVVTRNSPTSFGKASALEAYLRTFKYELNLPAPPVNRELSDYFLFELQKGYCDYFATAMVVMSRAIGIPARIAIGYTHGNYDPNQQLYIVSEDNAHSWVEIYFAEIGWIPFEPTPAQPTIRRLGIPADLHPGEQPSKGVAVRDPSWRQLPDQWGFWFVSVFACLSIAVIVWLFLDNVYLRWLSPANMTMKLHTRLFRFGRLIGIPAQMGDTPYEFTDKLNTQIGVVALHSRWDSQFRKAIDDIKKISHYYVFSTFSSHSISKEESKRILLLWRRLNSRLLLISVVNIWHRFITRGLFRNSVR